MVFPPRKQSIKTVIQRTLQYSHRFDYPLTLRQVWFWQIGAAHSLSRIKKALSHYPKTNDYYHLPHGWPLCKKRQTHNNFSLGKWRIARSISRSLSRIPTVSAVFVTGALAMDNTPAEDDIDIMVVTLPHALWLTRFLVVAYLKYHRLRRDPGLPEHSSPRVANKICDNLYLDLNHLQINRSPVNPLTSLYLAHEILQAKPIVDKYHTHHRFLKANSWAEDYLPVAYNQLIKTPSPSSPPPSFLPTLFLFPLNLLCYAVQYFYMKPQLTSEKVTLGTAFFHPRRTHL